MMESVAGALVWLAALWLLLSGSREGPGPTVSPPSSPCREGLELAVVCAGLLVVPHLSPKVLWIKGWLGAYLLYLLVAPLVLEWGVRRRSLAEIGVCLPQDRRPLWLAGLLVLLLWVVRVVPPLVTGEGLSYTWRGLLTNVLLYPYLEEKMFRGVIQTRLQAVLGAPRAWLISGLWFGLYHLYANYLVAGRALTPAAWASLAYLTTFGMLLGALAGRTRSLLPSFLIHMANNL